MILGSSQSLLLNQFMIDHFDLVHLFGKILRKFSPLHTIKLELGMFRLSHRREHSHQLSISLSADIFNEVFSISIYALQYLGRCINVGIVVEYLQLLIKFVIKHIVVQIFSVVI